MNLLYSQSKMGYFLTVCVFAIWKSSHCWQLLEPGWMGAGPRVQSGNNVGGVGTSPESKGGLQLLFFFLALAAASLYLFFFFASSLSHFFLPFSSPGHLPCLSLRTPLCEKTTTTIWWTPANIYSFITHKRIQTKFKTMNRIRFHIVLSSSIWIRSDSYFSKRSLS